MIKIQGSSIKLPVCAARPHWSSWAQPRCTATPNTTMYPSPHRDAARPLDPDQTRHGRPPMLLLATPHISRGSRARAGRLSADSPGPPRRSADSASVVSARARAGAAREDLRCFELAQSARSSMEGFMARTPRCNQFVVSASENAESCGLLRQRLMEARVWLGSIRMQYTVTRHDRCAQPTCDGGDCGAQRESWTTTWCWQRQRIAGVQVTLVECLKGLVRFKCE